MLTGFPPVFNPDAEILILGSMPSRISLEKYEYYGNERNHFWPIMETLFNSGPLSYENRKALLLSHRIALWDVVEECTRHASEDSSIKSVKANGIAALLKKGSIKKVLFNGAKAEELYKKHIAYFPASVLFLRLPSTSPAYTLPFEEKLKLWRKAVTC
jgi:G:T/U mismatch-specific DNA glycosylase